VSNEATKVPPHSKKLCRSCQRKINKDWNALDRKQKILHRLEWMKQKFQNSFYLPPVAPNTVNFNEDADGDFVVVDVIDKEARSLTEEDLSFPTQSFIDKMQQKYSEQGRATNNLEGSCSNI
jgi:hypothetical protein